MAKLKLYRIDGHYLSYLYGLDRRVQCNKDRPRPFLGIVLTVNEHQYYVPMESPKPNHAKMRDSIPIMKMDGGRYGILGFNNMIPVQEQALISFDIAKEPDRKYQQLLWNQLAFCNSHKIEIYDRAFRTYEAATEKGTPFFKRICCDFKLLEQEYLHYYP